MTAALHVVQTIEPEAAALLRAAQAGAATAHDFTEDQDPGDEQSTPGASDPSSPAFERSTGEDADAFTLESVRAELDEAGERRVVAHRSAVQLPNLGMYARAAGLEHQRFIAVYGSISRTGMSVSFTLSRDDMAVLDQLLPLDAEKEALAVSVQHLSTDLRDSEAKCRQLRESNGELERKLASAQTVSRDQQALITKQQSEIRVLTQQVVALSGGE